MAEPHYPPNTVIPREENFDSHLIPKERYLQSTCLYRIVIYAPPYLDTLFWWYCRTVLTSHRALSTVLSLCQLLLQVLYLSCNLSSQVGQYLWEVMNFMNNPLLVVCNNVMTKLAIILWTTKYVLQSSHSNLAISAWGNYLIWKELC